MKNSIVIGALAVVACSETPRSLLPPTGDVDMGTPTAPADLTGFDAGTFKPTAPSLTAISPKSVSTAGGAQITVTGTQFSTGTNFFINNLLANVMSVSATQAVLVAPPRAGFGPVQIVARNPDGQSAMNSNAMGSPTALSFYAAQVTFNQTSYPSQANRPRGAAFGDLNGDGKTDVILTHQDSASYSVFLGNGLGSFSPLLPTTVFGVIGGQATNNTTRLVDLNGDGKLDLLLGTNSANFHYYLGNGTGLVNQIAQVNFGTSGVVAAQAVADINGDNLPDVITANVNASNIGLFLNTNVTTNLFSGGQYQVLNPGGQPTRVQVADLNADGKQDLVAVMQNSGGPTLAVYFGTGVQTTPFAAASPLNYGNNLANQSPGWFELADVNNDGKLDCLVSDLNTNTVRVFIGNGTATSTFAAPLDPPVAVGSNPQQLALGDWNGDGNLDMVVTNRSSHNVSVVLGNGDGTFGARQDLASANSPWAVYALDLNGDKKTDFAVVNELNTAFSTAPGYLTVYLNTSQ